MTSRILFACGIVVLGAACVVIGDDRFWVATEVTQDLPTTAKIEAALRSTTEVAFDDNPLEEALNYLEDLHHIEIWIDKRSLQDEGIHPDQQVTLSMSGITLESALQLLLQPLRLTYVLDHEVLRITTQTKANEMLFTRVYPVRDLVDCGDGSDDYQTLMTAIEQSTGGKWMEIDQEGGAISPVDNARSLVIRQTQQIHREIEGMLAGLRKSKQIQGLGSVSLNSERPGTSRSIEPTETRTRPLPRSSQATPSWQRPRVYSTD